MELSLEFGVTHVAVADLFKDRWQFQAQSGEFAANPMDCQGNLLINGRSATWLASNLFDTAIRELRGGSRAAVQAADQARDKAARDEMKTLELRIRALACVVRNAQLASHYQVFLDRDKPKGPDAAHQWLGPKGTPEEARRTVEAHIENTKELIGVLESAPVPLLNLASTREEEDVFTFGPDLLQQLRRKIEIERNHFQEHPV